MTYILFIYMYVHIYTDLSKTFLQQNRTNYTSSKKETILQNSDTDAQKFLQDGVIVILTWLSLL